MMYYSAGYSSRRFLFRVLAVVLLGLALLPGCASNVFRPLPTLPTLWPVPGRVSRVYRASDLPAELAASPAVNLDTLDLSALATSSVAPNVICWGDLLTIEIDAGLPSLEPRISTVCVAKDGTAKLPLIGRVPVAGLEVEQAEVAVAEAARARNIYPDPYVSVRLASPRQNRVTVVGAVKRPGVYQLPRGSSSLMAAWVSAGGFAATANGEVELRHTDPRLASPGLMNAGVAGSGQNGAQPASHEAASGPDAGVVRVNLLEAVARGAATQELQDGDVVNVTPRELMPVHVLGLVMKPGAFEMTANRDMYLLDALALAGGTASPVADRVTIRRSVPGEAKPVTITASVRRAMDGQDNVLLAPGDTVMVRQTPETVVIDTIKTFIRVGIGGSVGLF